LISLCLPDFKLTFLTLTLLAITEKFVLLLQISLAATFKETRTEKLFCSQLNVCRAS